MTVLMPLIYCVIDETLQIVKQQKMLNFDSLEISESIYWVVHCGQFPCVVHFCSASMLQVM